MRRFVFFLIPLALVAAEDKSTKDSKKMAKTSQQTTQPQQQAQQQRKGPVTIPPDAVQIAPQVYRHTDTDGKTWLYRMTPFGISKMEDHTLPEGSVPAAPPAKPAIKVRATESGDSVRFEQSTPMGNRVWERKKSELTAQEKAWLDESKNSSQSPKPEK